MARNNQYPIMIGSSCPKQGIGIKSKLGSGYDLYILDEDLADTHRQVYGSLRREIYGTSICAASLLQYRSD